MSTIYQNWLTFYPKLFSCIPPFWTFLDFFGLFWTFLGLFGFFGPKILYIFIYIYFYFGVFGLFWSFLEFLVQNFYFYFLLFFGVPLFLETTAALFLDVQTQPVCTSICSHFYIQSIAIWLHYALSKMIIATSLSLFV